jgi:2'-5' RNA ligase
MFAFGIKLYPNQPTNQPTNQLSANQKWHALTQKDFRQKGSLIQFMSISFTNAWERRKSIQLNVTKYWVDNHWTKGRNQYLVFLVRITDEELVEKIVEIQNILSSISCVAPFPEDYFHISVAGLGFLAKPEKYEDDILIENLEKIVNQAEEGLQPLSGFGVSLSKLNIFPDVVFVEVHDRGKIEGIFRRLQAIPEIGKRKFGFPSFLPHISIMHFQNNEDFPELISHLEKLRDTEFGKMTINSIELVNAHLSKEYPKLSTIYTFKLK